MKSIAQFYTWFWIIYYPMCIAYYDYTGLGYFDEFMTVLLLGYTFYKKGTPRINDRPWKEFYVFLGILFFYIIYSLVLQVNVVNSVWLDLVQQIRPYSVIYCTWILAPFFSRRQKKWMMGTMILTLISWIILNPEVTDNDTQAEFPILGQLAICTGMSYYLLSKPTKRNKYIALLFVFTGLLAPKMKFVGEVVFFVGILFFLKRRLNFQSGKTIVYLSVLMSFSVIFTWTKFEVYYVDGWTNEWMARPVTYKTSLKILQDYFPFGSGMGTFATNAARMYYSPLYEKYGIDDVWGLRPDNPMFLADAYYPSLAQFGIVGVVLFIIFWKRRLQDINKINDMRHYHVALMAFFCLAIESTADSSYLSGKGMGYFMLLGICLNANRTMAVRKQKLVQAKTMKRKVITHEENKGLVVET